MLSYLRWAACLCVALCSLPAAEPSTGTDTLSARQLFYTPRAQAKPAPSKPGTSTGIKPKTEQRAPEPRASEPRASVPPAVERKTPATQSAVPEGGAAYLGIKYNVLKLNHGKLVEVSPDEVFRNGDEVKLRLQSNGPGYLYVVHEGTSGHATVLFPSEDTPNVSNQVYAGQPVLVPQDTQREQINFTFDDKPGTERLLVVFLPQPETNMDRLIQLLRRDSKATTASGGPQLMAQNRVALPGDLQSRLGARDIRVQRRPQASGSGVEEAVYVVSVAAHTQDQRIVSEILLKHQ